MKIYLWVVLAGVVVMETACASKPPEMLKTATIKDIMDSMVDPNGDFIFESVQQIADEKGVREKAPKTDAEWDDVRRHLFVLIEAPNLLVMDGREIARPEDHSRNPRVENEPEAVRQLVAADRPAFIRRARRLQDAATVAMEAVDAKDKDKLFKAITGIDKACESCHLHYWYPNDQRAQQAAREEGITD